MNKTMLCHGDERVSLKTFAMGLQTPDETEEKKKPKKVKNK